MTDDTLRKGFEPNLLRIVVDEIEIKPYSKVRGGQIDDGIIIQFTRYNLEQVLCQMIEDYGAEKLIQKIKQL